MAFEVLGLTLALHATVLDGLAQGTHRAWPLNDTPLLHSCQVALSFLLPLPLLPVVL